MNYLRAGRKALIGITLVLYAVVAGAASTSPVTILSVDSAQDGSNNLVVQGRVRADAGIASLDINDIPVSDFDGKNFSVQLSPASEYRVNLYGIDGSYQQIAYANPSAPVDSAIQLVIGNQLMQDVGPAMGTLLTDLDLNAVLGINPNECVIDTFFLWGCDLYIRELALQGTPDIDLYFTPNGDQTLTANISMKIPSAVVSTQMKRSYWWGYSSTKITTRDINVFFQVGVKATNNQSIKLVLDDPSDIQMSLGSMQVQSNELAAYMIPLFKDAITDLVNKHLVNIAGPFLNLLPIPAIPLNLPIDIDGDSVVDADFAINMNAELLDVLSSGDGQAVLAGSISSSTVAPGREVLGSRRISGMLPTADPVMGTTDLTASVSTNLVNQILTAVYQSGIEEKLVVPLKASDLGSFGSIVTNFGHTLDDQVNIALSFGAPPELQVNNSSLYPLGLQMALPNMRVLMTIIGADGTEDVMMDLTSDFYVATSLGADGTGKLYLEFNNLVSVDNAQITDGFFGLLFPPGNETFLFNLFLPTVLASYEPMINELLNAARLELDIGEVLGDWLNTTFPSVPVAGYVTETGVSEDESYMQIGMGIDFP